MGNLHIALITIKQPKVHARNIKLVTQTTEKNGALQCSTVVLHVVLGKIVPEPKREKHLPQFLFVLEIMKDKIKEKQSKLF